MAYSKVLFVTLLYCIGILFVMDSNAWAVASFAKKFDMECKVCHAFGSELNSLGQKFKKNGYTFGEKNAVQKDKPKQDLPAVDNSKASGVTSQNTDKPSPTADNSKSSAEVPDKERLLPETKVYRKKNEDGTMYFSDTPYAISRSDNKIMRSNFSPLSAVLPKKMKKKIGHAKSIKTNMTKLPQTVSQSTTGIGKETIPEWQPKNFEDCMEQVLVANPSPITSEATMELFQEAETICSPYKNKQK